MKKLFIPELNTYIFIDDFDFPEEEEHIKVWDTSTRYIDYFPIETLLSAAEERKTSLQEEYKALCSSIAHSSNIYELISIISKDKLIVAHKTRLLHIYEEVLASGAYTNDDIETVLNWSTDEQLHYLKSFYNVNIIGDFVLLNKEAY